MLSPVTAVAAGLLALAAPAVPGAPSRPAAPPAPVAPAAPAVFNGPSVPEVIPASLDWEVHPADVRDDAPAPAGQVEFQLGYRVENHSRSWGRNLDLAQLAGLAPAQLAGEGQAVSFVLHRDAGDFRCKGVAGLGKGLGTCVYAANPAFQAALAKRGVTGPLDASPQFSLAMSDIGLADVDELKRQRYATPVTDDLVQAGVHGVSLRRLVAMDAAGYRFGDLPTFVHAQDHGVSPRYVEALKAAGYSHLTGADLAHLRDHGVSATWIGELQKAGYPSLKADDLTRLRDHGVSVGFVSELHAMGYDALSPDELIKLRDHGINAGFIRVANQGGTRLSPDDLIRMRETGGGRR